MASSAILLLSAALILLFVILQVADNLLLVEARQRGIDTAKNNMGIFPSLKSLFRKRLPNHLSGASVVALDKGFDINLVGKAQGEVSSVLVHRFAVKPTNFRGIAPIPKMMVEVGHTVKAGDPLFFDKEQEDHVFTSPVSGEVIAINRGEKRSIVEIVVLADKTQNYRSFGALDLAKADRNEIAQLIKESGFWAHIRQRPYDIVATVTDIPSNIFVSTFDTAPLAPDASVVIAGREAAFQKGLDALAKLTSGKVYLGLDGNSTVPVASAFANAEGVEKTYFQGAHPAGNVGIQIHHIAPINGTTKAWTLGVQDVCTLGHLISTGTYMPERVVAITGAQVANPKYVRTFAGAQISDLLKDNVKEGGNRVVSGDVLSGEAVAMDGYLNIHDDQITVLKEGDYYEMFGWLVPQNTRPSVSRTYPNFLFGDLQFEGDTNTHGERRAFVVTGQYEDLLPMDVYPQHLMKAIMVNDFERMEGLGIHELIEEDIALAEFACTSKQPLQQILRKGLDVMHSQG